MRARPASVRIGMLVVSKERGGAVILLDKTIDSRYLITRI
jgi:hypothetical protein